MDFIAPSSAPGDDDFHAIVSNIFGPGAAWPPADDPIDTLLDSTATSVDTEAPAPVLVHPPASAQNQTRPPARRPRRAIAKPATAAPPAARRPPAPSPYGKRRAATAAAAAAAAVGLPPPERAAAAATFPRAHPPPSHVPVTPVDLPSYYPGPGCEQHAYQECPPAAAAATAVLRAAQVQAEAAAAMQQQMQHHQRVAAAQQQQQSTAASNDSRSTASPTMSASQSHHSPLAPVAMTANVDVSRNVVAASATVIRHDRGGSTPPPPPPPAASAPAADAAADAAAGAGGDELDESNNLSHTKQCRDRLNSMFDRLRDTLPLPPDGVDVKHKAQVLDYACSVLKAMVERTASLEAELALSSARATSDWATRAVRESPTFSAAASRVLSLFCLRREWTMAELWLSSPATDGGPASLCLDTCVFRDREAVAADPGLRAFVSSAYSHVLAPETGIVGRVWCTMRPEWLNDLHNPAAFARSVSAMRAGLHTCFAVPITVGGRVEGVIAFFDKRTRGQDQACVDVALSLTWALGNAVGGKRASELHQPVTDSVVTGPAARRGPF